MKSEGISEYNGSVLIVSVNSPLQPMESTATVRRKNMTIVWLRVTGADVKLVPWRTIFSRPRTLFRTFVSATHAGKISLRHIFGKIKILVGHVNWLPLSIENNASAATRSSMQKISPGDVAPNMQYVSLASLKATR